ncbi:MAG TPA: hypothetical protein DCL35_01160 [Candidatus Omnitrophica bacterium]|nr:hypothetical protein [Candidatus Omnitrophota bacterium]
MKQGGGSGSEILSSTEDFYFYVNNEKKDAQILFDSTGKPHIFWMGHQTSDPRNLCYTRWNGSAWTKADGATPGYDVIGQIKWYVADSVNFIVRLDSSDLPHILVAHTASNAYVGYKRRVGAVWKNAAGTTDLGTGFETLFADGAGHYRVNMLLDSNNRPHVIYEDFLSSTSSLIYYQEFNGTTWTKADGATAGRDQINISSGHHKSTNLLLDSSGKPHIAWRYSDSTNSIYDIYYTRWSGSAWVKADGTEGQDNVSNTPAAVSDYPEFILDNNGAPRIVWLDGTSLKYSWWNGSAWSMASGSAGADTIASNSRGFSFKLDSSNRPRIAWTISVFEDLSYTQWNGTAWTKADNVTAGNDTPIADTPGGDWYVRLELDASGYPVLVWDTAGWGWTGVYDAYGQPIYDYIMNYPDPAYTRWDGSNWKKADGTAGYDVLESVIDTMYFVTDFSINPSTGLPHILFTRHKGPGSYQKELKHITYGSGSYLTPGTIGGSAASIGLRYDVDPGAANDVRARWTSLDWSPISFPGNATSSYAVKFKIRGADTTDGLSSAGWYGPGGATTVDNWASGHYFGQVYGSVETSKTIPAAIGGTRYADILVRLESSGAGTPTLGSVTLNYETLDAPLVGSLTQYRADGITEVLQGGLAGADVVLKASGLSGLSDSTNVLAEFEIAEYSPTNMPFSNIGTDGSVISGGISSAIISGGFVEGRTYKWHARVRDAQGRTSGWTNYESGVPTDPDFETGDMTAPTVTALFITVTGATGNGGVFKGGNTITVSWDNSVLGDNNADISSVTVDFSQFGGNSAALAANAGNVWSASYALPGGVNYSNKKVSVKAIDAMNNNTTTQDADAYSIDTTSPAVTAAKIAVSGNTGVAGKFKTGDTVTVSWDNTASGDNNADISSVTVDFSQFGGGAAVSASNSSNTWTATYLLPAGQNLTAKKVSVTATDTAGNTPTTTQDDTAFNVDTTSPIVTAAKIAVLGNNGLNGSFSSGDTVTVSWDNTASGDNNADISSVTVDFSQFGGGAAVAALPSSNTWTATYLLPADVDLSNKKASVTAADVSGNITTTQDDTAYNVDTKLPDAPTGLVFTPAGGTVVADYVNSTNTGFTVGFTSPGAEYAGTAHLYLGGSLLATDVTASVAQGATQYTLTGNAQSITDLGADGAKTLTVKILDSAGNTGTESVGVNATKDTIVPSGGSVSYTNNAISYALGADITLVNGNDASGIASRVLVRAGKDFANDTVSGAFVDGDFTATVATDPVSLTPYPDATIQVGKAYKYRYVETDNAGNAATYASANTIKFFGDIASYAMQPDWPAAPTVAAGGELLGFAKYVVTRKDAFANSVSAGSNTAYLYYTKTAGGNRVVQIQEFRATENGSAITSIDITPGNSTVDFWYYEELMGAFTITVSDNAEAPDGATGLADATDSINVAHGAPDHLGGFAGGTVPAQVYAGQEFTLPVLKAVDAYRNLLNDSYGATPYSGAKTITYIFTGTPDAPNAATSGYYDSWTTSVNFTNGLSDTVGTPLLTTLYRAQSGVTITPSSTVSQGGEFPDEPIVENQSSDAMEILPIAPDYLEFMQQPSVESVINTALEQQPIIETRDFYGNKNPGVFSVTLYDSTSGVTFSDGDGALSADANPLDTIAGTATFGGVRYNLPGTIYLYAEVSGISPAFSNAIAFVTGASSSVEAALAPVTNFSLIPAKDTEADKFSVLKFKVNDKGGDVIPTLIDRIEVVIGGSGANASTDIAWAELLADGVRIATASGASITNTALIFGGTRNGDSIAALHSVPDNTTVEYTVNIYMKPSKLTAIDGNTYTFGIDTANVYSDTGLSSGIGGASGQVATVTGTITVVASHLEILRAADDAASISVNAGASTDIKLRAVDPNNNIDRDYGGTHTFKFSGLGPVGGNNPLAYGAVFGNSKTFSFTTGTSVTGALVAYKKEAASVSMVEYEVDGVTPKAYLSMPLAVDVAAGSASMIGVSSGNNQTGAVNGPLINSLIALVSDAYGNPAQGVNVSFATGSYPGGATGYSVTPLSASSSASGLVSTAFTLGNLEGTYTATATSAGLTGSPLTFTASALAPTAMNIVSGTPQSDKKVTEACAPFVVEIMAGASPVPNATVNFSITSVPSGAAGQVLSAASAVTDSSGRASTVLTLGDKIGTYTVRASYSSYVQDFTVNSQPGVPYKVVLTGPSSVKAGEMSTAFALSVQDEHSNYSPVDTNTVFNLSMAPSVTGVFYTDAAGLNPVAGGQITINFGSSNINLYYKDDVTASLTIGASYASGQTGLTVTADGLPFTVIPADVGYFTVTGSTAVMDAGSTRAITVTAYDLQGNVKTDYAGSINVVFSGADPSPSPSSQAPTVNGTLFGTSTALTFANGEATGTLALYKAQTVTIKATAGSTTTPDLNDLSFVVRHIAVNHLKFGANLPTPQNAGTAFDLETSIDAVDLYDNICDGANGATAYNSLSKTITYILSGTSNGPETGTDVFTNVVAFVSGRTTTPLSATLYRAQNTTVTPSTVGIDGVNVASNAVTVNYRVVDHLRFSQQPSTSGSTNQALPQQPIVAVVDQYGNPVKSASAQITLRASTTTGSYTAASNGTLSATTLNKSITDGQAEFANLKYSYPENIYLEAAAVSAYGLTQVYSFQISFGTAEDLSIAKVAQAGTISSLAYASASAGPVLGFTITDAGTDGYSGKIKQIIINNTNTGSTVGWSNFIAGALISDGTSEVQAYSIANNKITFGSGASTLYTVAEGSSKTYTLKLILKSPLPAGADNEVFDFKVDVVAGDIPLDELGSKFQSSALAVTDASTIIVQATNFKITSGVSQLNAGNSGASTLKAADANGNVDEDYTGDHALVFSGATVSPKGNKATAAVASSVEFADTYGASTPSVVVPFAAGVNSAAVNITPYKAEIASIRVYEPAGPYGAAIGTSSSDALQWIVIGGAAYQLLWTTEPNTTVVANAPWAEFVVSVTDEYGNTAASAVDVTVNVSGGSLAAGCVNTVAAVSGKASFTNFKTTASTYPAAIFVTGTAPGISVDAPQFGPISLAEKYDIILNVKDSVTNSALPEITPQVLLGETVVYAPGKGNSPFTFQLPYGTYTLSLDKEKYVQSNVEKTAGVGDDASDGSTDNAITWLVYMTSLEEATADYQVKSSFVYDEDLDLLTSRLWLERRGKLIVNSADAINKLGDASIQVYDETANSWMTALNIPHPAFTDYTNGVYRIEVSDVTKAGGAIQLTSGKTYFGRCTINYGGADGTGKAYETGATFTITISQSLKQVTDEIAAMSTQVATEVAGVKTVVAQEAETTRAGVTAVKTETAKILTATESTIPEKITSSETKITTQLTTIEKSQILNRESIVMLGSTIVIRYRTYSGAAPIITVYDPDNVIRVGGAPMTEATPGIYQYAVTFAGGWPRGDYSIVCSEPTYGTMDAITISAKTTDIENVSSDVNAVLGSVSPVRDIKSSVDAFSAAFNIIEDNIARAAEALAGVQAGTSDAEAAAGQLEAVFNNLKQMSAKIHELGATVGYDLEKLYDVNEARAKDIGYIRNKTQELKALLLLSQQMMEGAAKEEPVVQTWFEFR